MGLIGPLTILLAALVFDSPACARATVEEPPCPSDNPRIMPDVRIHYCTDFDVD